MKTLDEVIKTFEYCLNPVDNFGNCNAECPYIHCCDPSNHDVTEDALHYLKLLKAHCDRVQNQIEDLREEYRPNEPLTMEEFSRMIDTKPIWCQELQEWYLFLAYDDGDNRIQLMTDKGDIETFDEDDLEKYPLYRRK